MQPVSERNLNFSVYILFNQIYPSWLCSGACDSYVAILSNQIHFSPISIVGFFRLRKKLSVNESSSCEIKI